MWVTVNEIVKCFESLVITGLRYNSCEEIARHLPWKSNVMYKISFFVPLLYADKVKRAVFLTGAGRIGAYDSCCWETAGTGQFRPLSGSDPFIGGEGVLETVEELKVEMVCAIENIAPAINALKKAHPYETPAYEVIKLESF